MWFTFDLRRPHIRPSWSSIIFLHFCCPNTRALFTQVATPEPDLRLRFARKYIYFIFETKKMIILITKTLITLSIVRNEKSNDKKGKGSICLSYSFFFPPVFVMKMIVFLAQKKNKNIPYKDKFLTKTVYPPTSLQKKVDSCFLGTAEYFIRRGGNFISHWHSNY